VSAVTYLLWSNKHEAWWRPDGWGYTDDIEQAGRFSEADAVENVVRSANCGILDQVTSMVAAPDNWAPEVPQPQEQTDMVVVAGPGPLVDVLAEALPKLAAAKRAAKLTRVCQCSSFPMARGIEDCPNHVDGAVPL
jgi:hypothetical protein